MSDTATTHEANTSGAAAGTAAGGTGSEAASPDGGLERALSSLRLAEPPAPVVSSVDAALSVAAESSSTGLVYDERCLLHCANYAHVEQPARTSKTMALLVETGLYARCVHVPARLALDSELMEGGAHTAEHVASIDASAHFEYKPDEPDSETEGDDTLYPDCKFLDSDTYVNRHSAVAARLSAGGLIDLLDRVVTGQLKNGFAVIRPPGHHADSVAASGFCLYNNVAIGVKAIRARHPTTVRRALIVDWDVHHGNGIQNIFYEDPSVLYFSVHRYQGGAFYPHTGHMESTGGVGAPGSNINVPLNYKGMGDAEYLAVWERILLPVVDEFQPDLVVVSAGFDCAQGDPLGGMDVSSEGFAHLTEQLLKRLPHDRLVLALEGGYNVRAVSEAVVACTRVLLGEAAPALSDPHAFMGKRELMKVAQRKDLFRRDLLACIKVQQPFWKCFRHVDTQDATLTTTPPAIVAKGAAATAATPADLEANVSVGSPPTSSS